MRYRRQSSVPEVGNKGQMLLQKARVLCVGMGGLGNPSSQYLAGAGIGTLGLMDGDEVSISNLHRQVLFSSSEVGEKKVHAAKKRLLALNPDLTIHTYDFDLNAGNVIEIFSNYDLILDGTDRFATKLLINDACLKLHLPWVYASVNQWEGQTAVFQPKHAEGPCYRCFQPNAPKIAIENCAQAGVIGPVVGMLGTHQALSALQVILSLGGPELSTLKVFDGLHQEWMKLKIPKNPNCPACSKPLNEITLQDDPDLVCETSDIHMITAAELAKLQESGTCDYTILDVRDTHEWEEYHLDGALHFALSRLEQNEFPVLPKEEKLLVYCQAGKRSAKAAKILEAAGFQSITELKAGLSEWVFPC